MKTVVIGACDDGMAMAVRLAAIGHDVVCVDRAPRATTSRRAAGRMRFAVEGAEALNAAQAVFISEAVGPAAREVAAVARHGLVVVLNARAPAGAAEALRRVIAGIRPGLHFAVAVNMVRDGGGGEEDRIVVGADEPWARDLIACLFEPFRAAGGELVVTDIHGAEAIGRQGDTPAARADEGRDALVFG